MKTHRIKYSAGLIVAFLSLCNLTGQVSSIFQRIYSFPPPPPTNPRDVIQGRDGNFYGPTSDNYGYGSIYKMTPAGTLTILASFNYTNGVRPQALIQSSDGSIYGVAEAGGLLESWVPGGFGTVFKLSPSGGITTLVSFSGTNGWNPKALILGSDGSFYGVTENGGPAQSGTVFKMTPSGTLTMPASFGDGFGLSDNRSVHPKTLLQGADGNFYGVARGDRGFGTVFKMTTSGLWTTLVSFDASNDFDGQSPATLLQGADSNFYGVTEGGGLFQRGTIFKITPAGVLTTLSSFSASDGYYPNSLVQGSDGNFYGTTRWGGDSDAGTIFKATRSGTLTTLFSFNNFNGSAVSGASLVRGQDGDFYGTTYLGGDSGYPGYGTVFKMTPAGALTTLVSFKGGDVVWGPYSLVQDAAGDFYGLTRGGPSANGTVCKLTASGTLTTLVSFDGTNGAGPGYLIHGSDGNLYGTTSLGRARQVNGSVFKVAPSGTLTTLVSFNGADGALPGPLIQANDGDLYGTTQGGGQHQRGTVFKLTPAGKLTTLVSFNGANGKGPVAGVVQSSDGNFYGTTLSGGQLGFGTIFRMAPAGTLTTLVEFTERGPFGPSTLVEGTDGNLYGITSRTIFKVSRSGTLTTLSDAGNPGTGLFGSLVQGGDGNFYGGTFVFGPGYVPFTKSHFKLTPSGALTTLALHDPIDDLALGNGLRGSDGMIYATGRRSLFRVLPPPDFKSASHANGSVSLGWSAFPNRNYQVQFATNLTGPTWQNLGSVILATNPVMSFADPVQGAQRFYRVGLVTD